jgi:hypothetical protein
MEWIKIEKKWTEMARRLQSAATVTRTDKIGGADPGGPAVPAAARPVDLTDTGETGAREMAARAMV